jgi:hypothetical protein
MANYNRDMTAAPHDEWLLLLVPTGDPVEPLAIEIGWWEEDERGFVGAWRYCDEGPGAYPASDPVAWCAVPDIDPELEAAYRTAAVPALGAPATLSRATPIA